MDSRMNQFVRISRKNSRYFEYEDGTPFVPVGMNLCFERFSGGRLRESPHRRR